MPKRATLDADGKRVPLMARTTIALRERLVAQASASGRSLSQEVEHLLERALLTEDLTRAVREQIRQEMRAEFEARRTDPAFLRHMDETCGPAAYHRINGGQ